LHNDELEYSHFSSLNVTQTNLPTENNILSNKDQNMELENQNCLRKTSNFKSVEVDSESHVKLKNNCGPVDLEIVSFSGIDQSTSPRGSYPTQELKKNVSKTNSEFGFTFKGLHISLLNIQHLLPKLDEVKLLLNQENSVNIFGLCETFLTSSVSNDDLNIYGFVFERKDRCVKSGGGILVYLSDDIPFIRRTDLESNDIENNVVTKMLL
jgi:hypothetical protein